MDYEKIKEQLIADADVRDRIARRAYEIYLSRHGRPGHPAEDWLRAESEVLPGLVDEIIRKNREVMEAHDVSDPVMQRAAEYMEEELRAEGETGDAGLARDVMAEQAQEAELTNTSDDDMVPDARVVAAKVGRSAKKSVTKKAPAKAGAKSAAKSGAKTGAKAAAKSSSKTAKAPTKTAKGTTKKAGAAKTPAKGATQKSSSKPASKKRSQ